MVNSIAICTYCGQALYPNESYAHQTRCADLYAKGLVFVVACTGENTVIKELREAFPIHFDTPANWVYFYDLSWVLPLFTGDFTLFPIVRYIPKLRSIVQKGRVSIEALLAGYRLQGEDFLEALEFF